MMISPSPESEQPPMYPTTNDEPLSLHPSNPDPSVEISGENRQGPNFGGFFQGEEMGIGSFGGSSRAEDVVEGLTAERRGGGEFSQSEMKDGDFSVDLGKGLLVDDVGGGGRGVSGSMRSVSAGMAVLDEFRGTNGTGGVMAGLDEIFQLEMKEKLVLCDLEKGFAEDGGGSRQESEISLLELRKKQLLTDLENGCMFGKVIGGAWASETEDVSEGTLVLDKFCDVDGMKKVVQKSCGVDSGKMKGGEGINDGFDLGRSLKIEVIDNTAVVEQVLIREACGLVKKEENEMRSGHKKQKEVTDGKKARRARRKAKSLHGKEEILGKLEDMNARFQNSQDGHKLMYSRAEMEALRYVNVVDQQKFWSQVYDGLGPVAKEYVSLLSERAQPGPGVDYLRQSLRRKRAPGILSEANPKQVSVELGNLGQNMNKVVVLPDPSCVPDPVALNEGDSNLEIVESCEDSEDDDEYYASIQRAAFFVEGEPDFDAGPPEDGLEYLRRVRWEAAQILNVKVAKLDNRRLNKVQSVYMPEIPEIPDCPAHLLPLKQWEDAFLADFSKLRLALSGVESNSQQSLDRLRPFISCSYLSPSKSVDLEDEQACPGNEGDGPLPAEEAASSGTGQELPPRLSTILRMDSVARVSMLKKRIKKTGAMTSLSRNHCSWLFALCAVVDTPLDADTCAALRSLLRKCASLRGEKAEMDDEVVMLNILATVAGKYFGQSG